MNPPPPPSWDEERQMQEEVAAGGQGRYRRVPRRWKRKYDWREVVGPATIVFILSAFCLAGWICDTYWAPPAPASRCKLPANATLADLKEQSLFCKMLALSRIYRRARSGANSARDPEMCEESVWRKTTLRSLAAMPMPCVRHAIYLTVVDHAAVSPAVGRRLKEKTPGDGSCCTPLSL